MRRRLAIATSTILLITVVQQSFLSAQNKREQQVREDRQKMSEDESWYYDDLDSGIAEAKKEKALPRNEWVSIGKA